MRALVTGATGFIGRHVALALLERGYEVRALVRPQPENGRRAEAPPGVEPIPGDLRDAGSLANAVRGCQVAFHVAAFYDLWARNTSDFYMVNVTGTENLLDAARQAGLERVVYTSSVATIRPGPRHPTAEPSNPERGGDEHSFANPAEVHSHYKRSKILAEGVALARAARNCPVVIVNPSTPVGAGDVKPTPTGKIVLDFIRGRMPAFVDTGLNLVDVEDVAQGHLLALEKGRVGERYILGNQNVTLQEMLHMLALETGRKPPKLRLPLAVALAAAAISETLDGRLRRRPPAIPFEGVRMAATPMFYDASKARVELGLPQSPISEALRKSAEWFEQHGYC